MIPVLYDLRETDFGHLGLGTLKDALRCVVTEERNGVFELELEYPVTGIHASELRYDNIIKVDAGHRLKSQCFRIKRIDQTIAGRISIYAQHVSYVTRDLALPPVFRVTNATAQGALNAWLEAIVGGRHGLSVFSDVTTVSSTSLTIQDFENARQVLGGVRGSILQHWNGEYLFDNYDISLLASRGVVADTLISYGRNLIDINQEENIANTFTSIYPFAVYRSRNDDSDSADVEEIITLPEFFVDSEHVGAFSNRRILKVDFSYEFGYDVRPTVERLRQLARAYIANNNVGVPRVSISLSFVDLTKVLGSNACVEVLNLCDIVPVRFERLGINAKAKVVRVEWNVLLEQYEQIEIGELRPNLGDRLQSIEREIEVVSGAAFEVLSVSSHQNHEMAQSLAGVSEQATRALEMAESANNTAELANDMAISASEKANEALERIAELEAKLSEKEGEVDEPEY